MPEVAVNVPFDAGEVKKIICEELHKRLDTLGPLQLAKEYASFSVDYKVTIRLRRSGEVTPPKETLAWGTIERGDPKAKVVAESSLDDMFESGDPNEERLARNMPLTVETKDGKGGVIRKKVTVKE